jgi:hypothetical protein
VHHGLGLEVNCVHVKESMRKIAWLWISLMSLSLSLGNADRDFREGRVGFSYLRCVCQHFETKTPRNDAQ